MMSGLPLLQKEFASTLMYDAGEFYKSALGTAGATPCEICGSETCRMPYGNVGPSPKIARARPKYEGVQATGHA